MARTLRSDRMLFFAALALVCTSVVMVVSASVVGKASIAQVSGRQLGYAAFGLISMFAAMRTDYHHFRRPAVIWTLVGVTVVALVVVFLFAPVNGARRWIHLASLPSAQPSELAKLAAIIFTAAVLERRMHRINDVKYALLPIAFVTGLLAFLIMAEPDLGSSAVVVLIVMAMTVAAGLRWRHLVVACLLLVPVGGVYLAVYPHARGRVLAYASVLRPAEQPMSAQELQELKRIRHQGTQSLIALGSGGVFGVGLGGSQQKNAYLPEAHNDFILAIIGEELGLMGTTAILLCFLVIAWRGLRAALLAPDRFGTLVGIGLTMLMGIQALINMTVVTGMGPTKGIPLPLVSAGGSSLVVNLLAMGILLNISQQASATAAASVDAP